MRARTLLAGLLAASVAAAHEPDLTRLPLGDAKLSTAPRAGWLWSCQANFEGGRGARIEGPWIHPDGTYDLTAEYVVSGAVTWPHHFTISVDGAERVFTSNDLPDHATGIFPVQRSDDSFRVDPNPGHIEAKQMRFTVPLMPSAAQQPRCVPGGVGILLTGVALYSAVDALSRDAVAHEVQDGCHGHPQLFSTYHYHSITPCIGDKTLPGGHSALVGYALDGFGIFGPKGERGEVLSSADLDECHGHTHAIPWEGKTVVMYHYHGTADFPYTVGCLRGRYDFEIARVLAGAPQGSGPPGRDLTRAAARLGVSIESLQNALGPPPPDLNRAAKTLGISVERLREALNAPPR